jgi:hypothetical protein
MCTIKITNKSVTRTKEYEVDTNCMKCNKVVGHVLNKAKMLPSTKNMEG